MKTCHVCGALVDDRELVCPECGATVVKHSEGFALKTDEPVKKRSNPMGTTVSTGSGITDILRGDDDGYTDDYISGSMPISLSKTELKGDYSAKRKSNVGGLIFKFVLVVALIFGVYYLVTNVFMKKEGATEAEQVIDLYTEAVNEKDRDKLLLIIPPYITTNLERADDILEEMKDVHFDEYEIISKTDYSSSEVTALQDSIKLQTGKTANLKAACIMKIRLKGTTLNQSGVAVQKYSEVELEFVNIRDIWYLHIDTYSNPDFE